MQAQSNEIRFVICINNAEYPAALERRKIYQVLPDEQASAHNLLRVIDESGEDYLYPAQNFISVKLPPPIEEALLRAA